MADEINDGGPAFPHTVQREGDSLDYVEGMSQWDYYAAHAPVLDPEADFFSLQQGPAPRRPAELSWKEAQDDEKAAAYRAAIHAWASAASLYTARHYAAWAAAYADALIAERAKRGGR